MLYTASVRSLEGVWAKTHQQFVSTMVAIPESDWAKGEGIVIDIARPAEYIPFGLTNPCEVLFDSLSEIAGTGFTGVRLRTHFGLDQVESALANIRHGHWSEVLAVWDSAHDILTPSPSNVLSVVLSADQRLHSTIYLQYAPMQADRLLTPLVTFAMLQQLASAQSGIPLGSMRVIAANCIGSARSVNQYSNGFPVTAVQAIPAPESLFGDDPVEAWVDDLDTWTKVGTATTSAGYRTRFFRGTVLQMAQFRNLCKDFTISTDRLKNCAHLIKDQAWMWACLHWIKNVKGE